MPTDLDAGIIDQRVRGLVEIYGARLALRGKDDPARRASNAFCALCVATLLDLDLDEAVTSLTDSGEDGGIDAIHVSNLRDDQPSVTLFQAKYEQKTLEGRHAFPASEIPKLIETIRTIFDPGKPLAKMRDIEVVVEEIRSRMREGAIPVVRVVLCNNGPRWGADGDARIAAAGFGDEEVQWQHLNHRRLVSFLRAQKSIDTMLDFDGAAHHEDVSFRRVFVDVMLTGSTKQEIFFPYATHYIAMTAGELLRMGSESLAEGKAIDHRNVASLLQEWSNERVRLVGAAIALTKSSLQTLGIDESSSLQRIAAQFRRADLLDEVMRSLRGRLAKRAAKE